MIIKCEECSKELPSEAWFATPTTCKQCHAKQMAVKQNGSRGTGEEARSHSNHSSVKRTQHASPVFHPTSISKLILLSLVTLGFYAVFYWHIRNWSLLSRRAGFHHISPFWRAALSPFFCFKLFKTIAETTESSGVRVRFDPGSMAFLYLILVAQFPLSGYEIVPNWLADLCWFLAFVPIAFVQRTVNELNAAVVPGADFKMHLTKRSVGLVAGALTAIAVLLVVGWWSSAAGADVGRQAQQVTDEHLELRMVGDLDRLESYYAAGRRGSIPHSLLGDEPFATSGLSALPPMTTLPDCHHCMSAPAYLMDTIQTTLGDLSSYEFLGALDVIWGGGDDFVRLGYQTFYSGVDNGSVYEAFVLVRPEGSRGFRIEVAEVLWVGPDESMRFFVQWGKSTCVTGDWGRLPEDCPCSWVVGSGLPPCG